MPTFEEQEEGESHVFHRSIFPLIFRFILLVILVLLILIGFDFLFYYAGVSQSTSYLLFHSFFLIIVIFFFTINLIFITARWVSDIYVIKGKELTIRTGIITIKDETYSLNNVEAIGIHQTIIGKALNYGEIVIKREREPEMYLLNLPDPNHIKDVLEKNTNLGK